MAKEDKRYRVKVHPELFDRIKNLKNRALPAAGIVQNTTEITHAQLVEWNTLLKDWVTEIKEIREAVVEHIDKCNE